MSIALTAYWQRFVDQLIASGRYNNQSEVIRAGLRALEEKERASEEQEFDRVFAGGHEGEPSGEAIQRTIVRQKSWRRRH
jgi:antitoxin ParD1/3/4